MAEKKQNQAVVVILIIVIVGAVLFNIKKMVKPRPRPAAPSPAVGLPVPVQSAAPATQPEGKSPKKITSPGIRVELKQLTFGQVFDTEPVFSPNGRELAYVSFRQNKQNIYILKLFSQEEPLALTPGEYLDSHPSWLPDGQKIIFSSNRNGKNELYGVDKFTGEVASLNKDGSSPAISPDGEWLAFVDQANIWIMKLDSKEFTPLTKSGFNDWPCWGETGKEIYFAGGGLIKVYNMETGEVRNITSTGFADYPSASKQGHHLVYVSLESGAYDLWMMNMDGSKKVQLTGDEAKEYFPAWSPDGKSVVFASNAAGLSHLWLLTLPAE